MTQPDGTSEHLQRLFLTLLLLLLVVATLAAGTSGPISKTLIGAGVIALAAGWGLFAWKGKLPAVRVPGWHWLILLFGTGFLQLLPLPPWLLEVIAPAAAEHYRQTLWLVLPEVWMPLTSHPQAALLGLFFWAAAALCYVLACQLLCRASLRRFALNFLALFGAVYAVLALCYQAFPNGQLLWVFSPWPQNAGYPFASFVNPNHAAAFFAMLTPVVLAGFLLEKPRFGYGNLAARISEYFSGSRFSSAILFGLAALLTGTATFVSLSRGGIVASLISLALFGNLLLSKGETRRRGLVLSGFMLLLLIVVGWFGWDQVLREFDPLARAGGLTNEGRWNYWVDSVEMLRGFSTFGIGLGGFREVYPAFQTVSSGKALVDHAHNDFVELVVEGGLVGASLGTAWLLSLLRAGSIGLRRRRSTISRYLGFGLFCSLAALLFHSVVEFNLQIGALALLFFFVAGFWIATTNGTARRSEATSDLGILSPRGRSLFVLLVVGLLAGDIYCGGRFLLGTTAWSDYLAAGGEDIQQLQRAMAMNPWSAEMQVVYGDRLTAEGHLAGAEEHYLKALRVRPWNRVVIQRLGAHYLATGRPRLGGRMLWRGAELEQMHSEGWFVAGLAGLKVGDPRAVEALRRGLQLAPEMVDQILSRLLLVGWTDAELASVLPQRAKPWSWYADYLHQRKNETAAMQAYHRAMELTAEDATAGAGIFGHVAAYLAGQGSLEEALLVLQSGQKQYPQATFLLRQSGHYWERLDFPDKAASVYRQVLVIDPEDGTALKRLHLLEERLGVL